MWRLQLIGWYMSTPGGRLSAKQAEQKWCALEKPKEDNPDDKEFLWDLRGPEESPLRFWAKQEDPAMWLGVCGHEHCLEAREK
eukprot:5155045-Alexandrium_andersonii.AAC.1